MVWRESDQGDRSQDDPFGGSPQHGREVPVSTLRPNSASIERAQKIIVLQIVQIYHISSRYAATFSVPILTAAWLAHLWSNCMEVTGTWYIYIWYLVHLYLVPGTSIAPLKTPPLHFSKLNCSSFVTVCEGGRQSRFEGCNEQVQAAHLWWQPG